MPGGPVGGGGGLAPDRSVMRLTLLLIATHHQKLHALVANKIVELPLIPRAIGAVPPPPPTFTIFVGIRDIARAVAGRITEHVGVPAALGVGVADSPGQVGRSGTGLDG